MSKSEKSSNGADSSDASAMTWAALVKWLVEHVSWKSVFSVLLIALLLLPIAMLYARYVPQIFGSSLGPPKAADENFFYTLVSGNMPLNPTGYLVEEGKTYEFMVSGSVNLAYHRMVLSSIADTAPTLPWILDGEGEIDTAGQTKSDSLMDPQSPHGQLIAYVDSEKKMNLGKARLCPNLDSSVLISIDWSPGKKVPFTAPVTGLLWLGINEHIASDDSISLDESDAKLRIADYEAIANRKNSADVDGRWIRSVGEYFLRYAANPPENVGELLDDRKQRLERLQNPLARKSLWFDDNVGYLLVGFRAAGDR